jgi:hypothetical protein
MKIGAINILPFSSSPLHQLLMSSRSTNQPIYSSGYDILMLIVLFIYAACCHHRRRFLLLICLAFNPSANPLSPLAKEGKRRKGK